MGRKLLLPVLAGLFLLCAGAAFAQPTSNCPATGATPACTTPIQTDRVVVRHAIGSPDSSIALGDLCVHAITCSGGGGTVTGVNVTADNFSCSSSGTATIAIACTTGHVGNAGSYAGCFSATFDVFGRETAAASASCPGGTTPPQYGCANSGGQITCTQPCTGWPTLTCNDESGLQQLVLAIPANVGDVLIAQVVGFPGTAGCGCSAVPWAPGWIWFADLTAGGVVPSGTSGLAYHIVQAGEASAFQPITSYNTTTLAGLIDLTSVSGCGGSWAACYVSFSSNGPNTLPATASASTPGGATIAVGMGSVGDNNCSFLSPAITGITGAPSAVAAAESGLGISWGVASGSMSVSFTVAISGSCSPTDFGAGAGILFAKSGVVPGVPSATPSSGTAALTAYTGAASMQFTLAGAGGATSIVITNLPTATTSWPCFGFQDETTSGVVGKQSAWSPTGATFTLSGTTVGATDKIDIGCGPPH